MQMNRSNKIENLANRYVERHIKDKHLSNDTIKEINTSMNEDDIIYVINSISSILYEPIEISNTDKKKYWR